MKMMRAGMNMIRLKVKTWSWRPNKMPSIRKKRMPDMVGRMAAMKMKAVVTL